MFDVNHDICINYHRMLIVIFKIPLSITKSDNPERFLSLTIYTQLETSWDVKYEFFPFEKEFVVKITMNPINNKLRFIK